MGLEASARKIGRVVKLSRVRHPLINQDQTRAVLLHQLPEHVAWAGRLLVVRLYPGVRFLPAELPRNLPPERVDYRPIRFHQRIAGRDPVPHEHHASRCRRFFDPGFLEKVAHSRQADRVDAGEQVVQRHHGVGLAAAEVGLELYHRVAALPDNSPVGAHQQFFQTLGEVGPPEELGGVAVLVTSLPQVDLPEIGRELRLLVPTAGDVLVGIDHFSPRLEATGDLTFDRRAGAFSLLAAHLFFVVQPPQLMLHLPDLIGLGGGYSRKQPGHRVKRPIRIVTREGALMRPPIPHPAQLSHQIALERPQCFLENHGPGGPHHDQ